MIDSANDEFSVEDGVLTVHREVLHDKDFHFDEACRALLDSESDEILIDLSASTYINSTYVGIIAATFFQANAHRKTLRLRADPKLADVLHMAGFQEFIPIEIL